MGSTVMSSKILLALCSIIANENSMSGRAMSKHSLILRPASLGRISERDLPQSRTTMSSPKVIMKGKMSKIMEDGMAGSLGLNSIHL